MLYSIIVPVFNRKKYIQRCLNSIINQTFQDFEIIIVDDGSDDGTGEICDKYGKNHKKVKVVHQKNGGVSRARNTGLKMAEGEFAIFIDSDDYLPSDYLYQIMLAYKKYGMDFIYCTSFKVHTVSDVQYYQYRRNTAYSMVKGSNLLDVMDKGLFNSVVNKAYEMSLIKKYEIQFPEDISLGEDLLFNLYYLDKKKKFQFLILNKNFYIGWWKDTKGSLERGWRADFFEIQRKLLREKEKYINKWLAEGKISINRKIFNEWYYACLKECVEYYILHMKDMGVVQLVTKIHGIMHSPEYFKYVQMYEGRKWILIWILYNVFFSRLKVTVFKWRVKNE